MKLGLGLFLGMILCFAGCAPARVNSAMYSKSAYSPTDPLSVQILREFPPEETFVKIGEVSVEAGAYGVGLFGEETKETFEAKLKQETARMGGDAVVIKEDKPFSTDKSNPSWSTDTYQDKKGHIRSSGTVSEPRQYESGRKFFGIVIKFTK